MIAAVRRKGDKPRTQPEVVVFEEPGLVLKNKAPGKGRVEQIRKEREERALRKAKKIYKEEKEEGNALPSSSQTLCLSNELRAEILELGASNMDDKERKTALKNWKKWHPDKGHEVKSLKTKQEFLPYPKYMDKLLDKRLAGDPEAFEFKSKYRRNALGQAMARAGHINRTKVGSLKNGILRLSETERKRIEHRAKKTRKR